MQTYPWQAAATWVVSPADVYGVYLFYCKGSARRDPLSAKTATALKLTPAPLRNSKKHLPGQRFWRNLFLVR